MKLKRYDLTSPTWCGGKLSADADESPDGDWVKWEDVAAMVAASEAKPGQRLTAEVVLTFAERAQQTTSISASEPILLTPIQLGCFAGMVRDFCAAVPQSAQGDQKPVGEVRSKPSSEQGTLTWPRVVWADGLFALPGVGTKLYTTPQPPADERPAPSPLDLCGYMMTERHLSGYRLILGFDNLKAVQDAHMHLAGRKYVGDGTERQHATQADERLRAALKGLVRYDESEMEGGGVCPSATGPYVRVDEVRAALAALPPAQSAWIGVVDRLPEEGDLVLISGPIPADVESKFKMWRSTASFRAGYFLDANGCTRNSATHWQPLPPAPGVQS